MNEKEKKIISPDDEEPDLDDVFAPEEDKVVRDTKAEQFFTEAEEKKDHWKLIPNLDFIRKKAFFQEYISSRMSILLNANRGNVKEYCDQEIMQLCIEGVWRQLELKFREWCDKLLD